jgi:SAM-dependent methyltransferase
MDIRTFFKRWPRLYYFIGTVFGPMFFTGMSAKSFLARFPTSGKVLNIGSGPRIIAPGITNIDMTPYAGVEIPADATAIPLPEGSAARVISDNVFEHLRNPERAVAEIHRLLEVGGVAYIATPFLYPFHSSPSDYQRWTKTGLETLFADFEIVESGVRAGPFSALCAYACHLTGVIFSFGSPFLNSLFTNLSMFVLFPIKLPDLIFNHWPGAEEMAAVLYIVIRKK